MSAGLSEDAIPRSLGRFRRRRDGTVRGELTDAAAIEDVLIHNAKRYTKSPGILLLRPVLGDGIFISEGERWRRNRRLMQPAFTRENLERYAPVMVARMLDAIARWREVPVIDLLAETRELALRIAVECLFGSDISDRDARQIGAGIEMGSAQMQRRADSRLAWMMAGLPTPSNLRTRLAIHRLQKLVDRIIEERRRSPGERTDLLSLLEAATDPEVGSLSDRDLRDEVNTLLLAGHETTALTFAWALYELARNPDADAELGAEARSVLGGGRRADASDLARLPVAASVVKEALRLYPPLYVVGRQAQEDVHVGGVPMAKGSRLRMYSMNVQRDPAVFDDPDAFRPSRWRDGADREVPRGRYFPFSLGPRTCIGSTFATMELVLGLATLRARYRLELVTREAALPTPRISLQPDRRILMRLVEEQPGVSPAASPPAAASALPS